MSNRLIDKINTYSLAVNSSFDENFTASTRPTNTGSCQISTTTNMTYYNTGISSNSKGPFPGQKSWNFTNAVGSAGIRYSNGSGNNLSSPLDSYIRGTDGFTYGIWVRPKTFNSTAVSYGRLTNYTASAPSANPFFTGFYAGIAYDPAQSKNGFLFSSLGYDTLVVSDHNGNDIVTDKWYYVAIRRICTFNGTTGEYTAYNQYYINGTLKATTPNSVTTSYGNCPPQYWWYGAPPTTAVLFNYDIADCHMSDPTTLNATAIANIWNYGAPIQVPVKYYDGSAWQTSSDKKIYDGSEWIPMYANKWDGSAWLPI